LVTRRKASTVLVQARLSERLVREIDRLVEEGWYKSRTEAIEDAIRGLLMRFRFTGEAGRFVFYRSEGRLTDVDPLEIVLDPGVREEIVRAFGTDSVDDVVRIIRRK